MAVAKPARQLCLQLGAGFSEPHEGMTAGPLPALETLLARSDVILPVSPMERDASLLTLLFNVDAAALDSIPVAAISRVADSGTVAAGWWLRADPVHLMMHGDHLALQGPEILQLSTDEAQEMAQAVQALFAEGQIQGELQALHPQRWYLRLSQAPQAQFTPLHSVIGRDIFAALPQGPQGGVWRTLLTEVQALLHTNEINSEREARGALPVNSLWFWGSGELPAVSCTRWTRVWSDDPLTLGLAQLAGIPATSLAPSAADCWRPGQGEQLVALSAIAPHAWEAGVQAWERDWFAPLLVALRVRQLDSLTLVDDGGQRYVITSAQARRRWWRRRKPLTHYLRRIL